MLRRRIQIYLNNTRQDEKVRRQNKIKIKLINVPSTQILTSKLQTFKYIKFIQCMQNLTLTFYFEETSFK